MRQRAAELRRLVRLRDLERDEAPGVAGEALRALDRGDRVLVLDRRYRGRCGSLAVVRVFGGGLLCSDRRDRGLRRAARVVIVIVAAAPNERGSGQAKAAEQPSP